MLEETETVKERGILGELYHNLFGKHWEMWIGSVLIAAMSVGLFLLAQPFGASCALKSWGDVLYGYSPALSMCAWSLITIFLGSMGASLLSNEFAIRIPPVGELVKGLIGGVLMAFGAILGKGCTLGSFFSGWAALSAGALAFAPGLAIGAFIAAKYLIMEVDKFPKISQGKSYNFSFGKKKKFVQPLIGLAVIVVALLFPLIFGNSPMVVDSEGNPKYHIIGFMVIGVFLGITLQRSRWCVVRALREPWMSGDSKPAKAIMAGILVSMFGIVTFKFAFPDTILPTGTSVAMTFVFPNFWLRGLLGGLIFGIGMVLAGGCAVGSIWRSGEGQVKLMISTLAMFLLMPLFAKAIISGGKVTFLPDWAQQKIFLPDVMGYGLSIALIAVICLIWYIFVSWNDKSKKFAAY